VYKHPIEALGVFMVLRLYLFGRYLRSSSSLYSQWIAFVGSLNDVNAMKPFFHFKALFKIKPLHLLVPLTLFNTFLTAAIIRILEQPVQVSFENYWQAVWLTAVTIVRLSLSDLFVLLLPFASPEFFLILCVVISMQSATGFGDYFPVTYLGRAFTTVSAMFGGILLVALLQSLFFGALELSPNEEKVRYLIRHEAWEKKTHSTAVRLIQTAWKLKTAQTAASSEARNKRRVWQLTLRFYDQLRQARALRETEPLLERSTDEQLAEMEETVMTQLRRMQDEEAVILQRIQDKTQALGQAGRAK
jgi:hypothetical protein